MLRTRRRRVSSCVSPQTSCLSRVGSGTNPANFRNIFLAKHCTLTPHVKAADFASLTFYPRMRAAANRTCCNAAYIPRTCRKNTKRFTEHVIGLGRRNAPPDPRKSDRRNMNRKECEMRGVIFAAMLAMTATGAARAQDAAAGREGLCGLQGLSSDRRDRKKCRRSGAQRRYRPARRHLCRFQLFGRQQEFRP